MDRTDTYTSEQVNRLIQAAWLMHHTLNYRAGLRHNKALVTDDERRTFASAINQFLDITDLALDIAR